MQAENTKATARAGDADVMQQICFGTSVKLYFTGPIGSCNLLKAYSYVTVNTYEEEFHNYYRENGDRLN